MTVKQYGRPGKEAERAVPIKSSPETGGPGRDPQQTTNLVGNDAVGMVEITMEEVGKGHYLGMKYLFGNDWALSRVGEDGSMVPDSMAAVLLRRLGLTEPAVPEDRLPKIRKRRLRFPMHRA